LVTDLLAPARCLAVSDRALTEQLGEIDLSMCFRPHCRRLPKILASKPASALALLDGTTLRNGWLHQVVYATNEYTPCDDDPRAAKIAPGRAGALPAAAIGHDCLTPLPASFRHQGRAEVK